ncbi:hypothetical protein TYRP_012569 [Tyrophagus putrescentiae]|nr:hypothetical protein TYRP_012569 [Tyrophagus putrescentiae]
MASKPSFLLIIILLSTLSNAQVLSSTASSRFLLYTPQECRTSQSNCTDMVHPYLQNPQYMFPTSLESVNNMCKMWSKFVDCIRRYISNCFEESRRALFHKSVENSIDTVHAICSSKMYQNEYLAKATCFKQVSIDYCGVSYQQLIDIVANENANDDHICCYYAQFKNCVNRPLLEECGRKAKNLMDHSMSFLISRCNYYSSQINGKECTQPQVMERTNFFASDDGSATTASTVNVANHNKIDTAASSRIETDAIVGRNHAEWS